jgi:diguanylate cyclase (GGDEF)-like protein
VTLALKYLALLLPLCFCLLSEVSLADAQKTNQTSLQQSTQSLAKFNNALIEIEKLKNSNAYLALTKLTMYAPVLNKLSLKQQVNYYNMLADIYLLQVQYKLAAEAASDGLKLTLGLSSPSLSISELLYSRGFAYESIGNITEATKDYENGLELAKSLHDKELIATGLINLGAIYYLTDRYKNSLMVLNDAYNIAKQTDNDELKGSVNSELGILYSYLGRKAQASVYYQQSYQFYKNANKKNSSLNALINIGINHLLKKEYQQAITIYKTIIEESNGGGQNEIMYNTYSGLSRAYLNKDQPDPETSYQYLLLSKQYMLNLEQYNVELKYYNEEAFVLFELERFDDVLKSIDKIEEILKNRDSLSFRQIQKQIKIINLKSKTYFEMGSYHQAYLIQNQRLTLIKALGEKEQISSIAEVRLALEVKQADVHTKLLENEKFLQEVALLEAENKQQQQRYYLFYIAVIALIFSWLLIKLIQNQRRLYKMLNIDTLTGVANSRKTLKTAKSLFNLAKNQQSMLSVLIIDIDDFKMINNQFGRNVGDVILKKMIHIYAEALRKTDFLGRIGGEEFLVLLPKTSHEQAFIIAENIRLLVEKHTWDEAGIIDKKISISFGISCSADFNDDELKSVDTLINAANCLLYQSKNKAKVCS